MNIGEYLFEKLIEEKNLVEELINIDNKIQYTNLTYSEFIKKVKQIKVPKIGIRGLNNFITDGEPDTIFAIMMNMAPMVKKININRTFIGLNAWLIEKTREYFFNNNIDIDFELDINLDYKKYLESKEDIVIYGYQEFVEETKELFKDKNCSYIVI